MHGGAGSRGEKRNGSLLTEHASISLSKFSSFFFSQNTEVCICMKSGHGSRAQTAPHGASPHWVRRSAVTLKENNRYKTQGEGSRVLVLAWRDLLYEYQFSLTPRYALSIYSHIKEEDVGVRETVGQPLISNSFQDTFKSLYHFIERKTWSNARNMDSHTK